MIRFFPPPLLLFVLILFSSHASAQWIPTGGPIADGPAFYDLEFVGEEIWASNGALYRMPVDGEKWSGGGSPDSFDYVLIESRGDVHFISSLDWFSRVLPDGRRDMRALGYGTFAAVELLDAGLMLGGRGVFVSSDSGESYRAFEVGSRSNRVFSLAQSNEHVYAGTLEGLYRSDDSGVTWTSVSNGIPLGATILKIVSSGSELLASTFEYRSLYRSTDAGMSWAPVSGAFEGDTVYSLAVSKGRWFAGSGQGIFRSSDAGMTWTSIGLDSLRVTAIAASADLIFAGTRLGVHRSRDDGASWQNIRRGLSQEEIVDLVPFGKMLLAAAPDRIWRTQDSGEAWEPGTGAGMSGLQRLAADKDRVYAASASGLFSSTDGIEWEQIDSTLARTGTRSITQLHLHKGVPFVVAGGNSLTIFRFDASGWKTLMPSSNELNRFYSMTSLGDSLVAAATAGVYYSTDMGESWQMLGFALPGPTADIGRVFTVGGDLHVSIPFGIYRLKAGSTTWERISDTVGIREVAVGPDGMVYAKTTGLLESADSGRTWRSIDEGLEGLGTRGLALHRGMLYTGVSSLEPLGNPEQKGVWRRSVARPVSRVREVVASASHVSLAPNPSTGATTLSFTLASATHATITVHSIDGRLVRTIGRELVAGRNEVVIDDLPSGVYNVGVGGSSYTLVVTR